MTQRLVLAGLGHAHLFVLEAAAQGRLGRTDVLVCTGEDAHVYSGMVPGWLGGRYAREELALDAGALCRRAGATRVPHHVTGLDPVARTVQLANGASLRFDLCSVAVGSQPVGLDVPGAREHAMPLKPFTQVQQLRDRLADLATRPTASVTVVGAGLAGLEIALAARACLERRGAPTSAVSVTVVGQERALVPDRAPRFGRLLARACARRAVVLRLGASVVEVAADAIRLADGRTLPSDLTIWATGAMPPPWLAASGLATDARGFLLVDDHLRAVATGHVFAAGDCATPAAWRDTPKAGVYAVRMGPVLADTLAALVHDRTLPAPYVPQRDHLALVNTGDGRAIAGRGRLAAEGRWAMWWKDHLDRSFVARFRAGA